MQKWARMLVKTGRVSADPSAMMTQMRGHRLLEFATINDLVLAIVFVSTKHPEASPGIAQMDNITTKLITF